MKIYCTKVLDIVCFAIMFQQKQLRSEKNCDDWDCQHHFFSDVVGRRLLTVPCSEVFTTYLLVFGMPADKQYGKDRHVEKKLSSCSVQKHFVCKRICDDRDGHHHFFSIVSPHRRRSLYIWTKRQYKMSTVLPWSLSDPS